MAYRYGDPTVDAKTILSYAGLPQTGQNIAAVSAWLTHENGVNNNPLGVTHPVTSGGQTTWQLSTFSSKDAGLKAAANLLASSSNYTKPFQDLKSGNKGTDFVRDISLSPWSQSHYGISGGNVLTVSWYGDYLNKVGDIGTQLGDIVTNIPIPILGTASSVGGQSSTDLPTQAQNAGNALGGIFGDVQTALIFVAVVLVGIVFLGGGFYLAKK